RRDRPVAPAPAVAVWNGPAEEDVVLDVVDAPGRAEVQQHVLPGGVDPVERAPVVAERLREGLDGRAGAGADGVFVEREAAARVVVPVEDVRVIRGEGSVVVTGDTGSGGGGGGRGVGR